MTVSQAEISGSGIQALVENDGVHFNGLEFDCIYKTTSGRFWGRSGDPGFPKEALIENELADLVWRKGESSLSDAPAAMQSSLFFRLKKLVGLK